MRLPFLLTSLLPLWLALLPACSVSNTSHCGNLDGNATCSQRGATAPYCNICVADNDGCVAALPEASCLATTAAATSMTTTSATTSDAPTSTTTGTPTTGSTSEIGVTSTSSTTDTTAVATTGQPDTTSSTTTGTTTSTTTGDSSTGDTSTGDTSTGDTSTTVDTTGDTDTGGTTMIDPLCGNNMLDGDEVCDGTNLDGKKCATIVANKWGGGSLSCNANCESFNDTKCCIGVGMACNILAPRCCNGLMCSLGGVCVVK